MRAGGNFGFRWVAFLILGLIAWLINDWALEQQSFYIFLLQMICLAIIAVYDVSQFVRGHLKFRPDDENQVNLLEVPSFQLFLAVYLLLIAAVVIINFSAELTGFFMSPFGLWLVFVPVMLAALIMSRSQVKSRSGSKI